MGIERKASCRTAASRTQSAAAKGPGAIHAQHQLRGDRLAGLKVMRKSRQQRRVAEELLQHLRRHLDEVSFRRNAADPRPRAAARPAGRASGARTHGRTSPHRSTASAPDCLPSAPGNCRSAPPPATAAREFPASADARRTICPCPRADACRDRTDPAQLAFRPTTSHALTDSCHTSGILDHAGTSPGTASPPLPARPAPRARTESTAAPTANRSRTPSAGIARTQYARLAASIAGQARLLRLRELQDHRVFLLRSGVAGAIQIVEKRLHVRRRLHHLIRRRQIGPVRKPQDPRNLLPHLQQFQQQLLDSPDTPACCTPETSAAADRSTSQTSSPADNPENPSSA